MPTLRALSIAIAVIVVLAVASYALLWLLLLAAFAAPILAVVWTIRTRRREKGQKRGTVTVVNRQSKDHVSREQ